MAKQARVNDAGVVANYHEGSAPVFRRFTLNRETPESKEGPPLHNKYANDPLVHTLGGNVPEEQSYDWTHEESQRDANYEKRIERDRGKDILHNGFPAYNA